MLKTIAQVLTSDLPAIAGEVAALFKTRHPGRESRFSSQALHAVALSSLESIARPCEPFLAPDIARKVLAEMARPDAKPEKPTPDPLTPREVEILRLVATGKSNKAIAEELFVSEATVRTHMTSILSKLHLANRVQATLYALREGIASLEE